MHRVADKLHDSIIWVIHFIMPPSVLDTAVSRWSFTTLFGSAMTFLFGDSISFLVAHDAEVSMVIKVLSAVVFFGTGVVTVYLGLAKAKESRLQEQRKKIQDDLDAKIKRLKLQQLEEEAESKNVQINE